MSKRSKKEVEAIVSGMGVFTSIISRLVELVKELGGSIENLYRLAIPEGSETLKEVARVIVASGKKITSEFLKLISIGETLTIDACDGTKILADAKDVFAYIDSDFKNWGADEKGAATEEIAIEVCEMVKDGMFAQLFGSLSTDVQKLCLTQNQIVGFVKKHRNWLRTDGRATFFLFKANGELFVADVNFNSDDSLYVNVYRFVHDYVWDAVYRRRVVVPRLA